jgi:hypothetical protein
MEGIGVRLLTRRGHGGTMNVISGSEQWYLLQLRVLGAWWRLGSSALEPPLLLRYSLQSPAAFHTVSV